MHTGGGVIGRGFGRGFGLAPNFSPEEIVGVIAGLGGGSFPDGLAVFGDGGVGTICRGVTSVSPVFHTGMNILRIRLSMDFRLRGDKGCETLELGKESSSFFVQEGELFRGRKRSRFPNPQTSHRSTSGRRKGGIAEGGKAGERRKPEAKEKEIGSERRGISEKSGRESEKEDFILGPSETSGTKVERWLTLEGKWGEGSEARSREQQKFDDRSGAEKGKRGRPTKAESLGRGRRGSRCSGSIASLWSKRERESDSEPELEEKGETARGVKRMKENTNIDSGIQEGKWDDKMDEIERIMRKLLKETKEEIFKKLEQIGEEIRKEVRKEMKNEIRKIREEGEKAREKVERELEEMRKKGENVREAVDGVFERLGVREKAIQLSDVYKVRVKENECMIVVKLRSMDDKRMIMEKKSRLKGSKMYVDDDMTKSERERQSAKDEEFWKFLKDYEVIGLVETWVDEKEWEKLKEKMPEEWKWKCQPARRDCKKGRAKGGIVTGVRKELEEREVGYEEKEGFQEREVVIDRERWRFMIVYNREGRKEGLEKMKEVIREDNEGKLIIAGDFNARIGKEGGWGELSTEREETSEKERVSKDKMINKQGRDLMEVMEERGWMVLNGGKERDEEGEWTYEGGGGKSVIDYGIVNWEAWERVERFEVKCRAESDHLPIVIDLGSWYERGEVREEEERVQDWSDEGIRKFRQAIGKIEWRGEGVREAWEELERGIMGAVEWRNKVKRKGIGWCPWLDSECREKKREMHKARRRHRKEQEERRHEEFIRCRKEYRELCGKKQEEQKRKEEKEVEKIRTEAEAWKFINKGRKKKEDVCRDIKMKEWIEHFMKTLGGVEERKVEVEGRRRIDRAEDEGIGEEEIKNEIRRVKRGKAAGIDQIRNEAWKEGGEKVGERLGEVLKMVSKRDG
ncbi:PREDICTED: golgin subfamily A member 6-like protein 22 [Cyphomyrmex costatus]|uniref:golgin subfamily A member 6-like protein 22 n=1 Tax=Cyphomyrmex costatus TaxID=456900 RepID=UPI0008523D3A|nr:PREDICTED: golgin subfamily A member 6-like protein 22 [Cyphomyrmex costatus]